jgi:predicted RNase H-like nuclease
MSKVNHPELFMRVLAEALEEDRLIRNSSRSLRYKASAERYKKLYRSDLDQAMKTIEPLDCIQLMQLKTPNLRTG